MKDREGPITVTVHPEKSQGGNEKRDRRRRVLRPSPDPGRGLVYRIIRVLNPEGGSIRAFLTRETKFVVRKHKPTATIPAQVANQIERATQTIEGQNLQTRVAKLTEGQTPASPDKIRALLNSIKKL